MLFHVVTFPLSLDDCENFGIVCLEKIKNTVIYFSTDQYEPSIVVNVLVCRLLYSLYYLLSGFIVAWVYRTNHTRAIGWTLNTRNEGLRIIITWRMKRTRLLYNLVICVISQIYAVLYRKMSLPSWKYTYTVQTFFGVIWSLSTCKKHTAAINTVLGKFAAIFSDSRLHDEFKSVFRILIALFDRSVRRNS